MQEEVENKTVSLAIRGGKLTAQTLKNAILKYLAYQRNRRTDWARAPDIIHHGKQTVKQLIGQNQGVANIEITEKNIKSFDSVARKYGIDYAIRKDKSENPPRYLVFFKARDSDALTAAFKEFTNKVVKRKEKPSIRARLTQLRRNLKNPAADKTRRKEPER